MQFGVLIYKTQITSFWQSFFFSFLYIFIAYWCVFLSDTKKKKSWKTKHTIFGKWTTFPEHLFGVFEYVMHQSAKIHGNHPVWEYQTTLQKTYPFIVFSFLRTKMLKRMQNTRYGERTALPKINISSSFFLLVTYKTTKCMEITVFEVMRQHY